MTLWLMMYLLAALAAIRQAAGTCNYCVLVGNRRYSRACGHEHLGPVRACLHVATQAMPHGELKREHKSKLISSIVHQALICTLLRFSSSTKLLTAVMMFSVPIQSLHVTSQTMAMQSYMVQLTLC